MTATDELRRLLDERGIEHIDFNMPERSLTLFAGDEHDGAYTENSVDTILTVYGASPEQAIEATLGSEAEVENTWLKEAYGYWSGMFEAEVAENTKLRELVLHMHTCLEHYEPGDTISCEMCPYDNETWGCDYERLMAELGIEVDA